jgi:hypothetical protein
MPRKPKPPPNDLEQLKRFKEMARAVEVDETPGAMDRVFEKMIPTRPRITKTPRLRPLRDRGESEQ